jgi:hypothetical protein
MIRGFVSNPVAAAEEKKEVEKESGGQIKEEGSQFPPLSQVTHSYSFLAYNFEAVSLKIEFSAANHTHKDTHK